MTMKRVLSCLLAFVMVFAISACGTTEKSPTDTNTTTSSTETNTNSTETTTNTTETTPTEKPDDKVLVIGVDAAFDAKWNPFLAETAYDMQIIEQLFTPICIINSENELEDYAGTVTYELLDNGNVEYTVSIQDGITYTDGSPVTIDDYIYGIYVRSDPSYTGPNNLLSSKIAGVEEYYYDNPNYSADIAAMEAEAEAKYTTDKISFEDFMVYAKETSLDGWWNGDPAGDVGNGENWSWYADVSGYTDDLAAIDATNADQMFELITKIEYETALDAYDCHGWYLNKMKSDYAMNNLSGGINVPEISGVTKIDDYSCTILMTVIDIYADRSLTVTNGVGNLIPRHYYGDITKGDVSKILANMQPMGSGPYIFGGYADNIVTCTANENFFLGVPKTGTVRWQVIPNTDILENIISGAVDIAEPSASLKNVDEIKNNPHVRYDLIDNPGYGYMAMNTQNITLTERKAVWSLMNRVPSVEGYYGTELAQVIERPMTMTVAEYPKDAQPYYEYSRDKALEYFTEAGYTQKDGKLVDANGNQFIINCYIGGQGKGEHPAYAMLVQAGQDLAALGGEIQIQDVNMNTMMAAVDDGTADMWIMAWTAVYDCDKSTQFRSTGGQNKYRYNNPKMDDILDRITQTLDLDERRALVAEMLDMSMEDCVEFPLYQRKNMLAYNGDNVDLDTIPQATTAASYVRDLWKVTVK